jgi:hypothetical protein
MRPRNFCALGMMESQAANIPYEEINSQALVNWMVEGLNAQWYILCPASNEYHIPGTYSHQRRNFMHPGMIIGYDPDRSAFQWVTYLKNDRYGISYGAVAVPFAQAIKALCSRSGIEPGPGQRQWPLRIRPKGPDCVRFDFATARIQLKNYLNGRGAGEVERGGRIAELPETAWLASSEKLFGWWGLASYGAYGLYLSQASTQGGRIDMRNTRAFLEHKEIMNRNLCFWANFLGWPNPTVLPAKHESIVAWSRALHYISLGYNTQGRSAEWKGKLLAQAEKWEEMRDLEEEILQETLNGLARLK